MKVRKTDIPGVRIIEPRTIGDERGLFHGALQPGGLEGGDRSIVWNDPDLEVVRPCFEALQLSNKDCLAADFATAEIFE